MSELELTGERFHPSMRGAIRYEHLHRYALCLNLVDGLDVLDIASGEGYGSALLASRARRVIGVDVEPRAVEHARRTYYRPNVRFLAGDCTAIPLADAAVDVVVSFETLEHIGAHDQMLAEIRRVLRPGGRLVISSPNKLVYSDEPGYENPYHVRELYYDEFLQLLERNFASVRVHGQRLAAASFVYPLVDRLAGGLPSYGVNGSEARDGLPALDRPMYFIAVCGDAPHDGPGIDSLFVDAHDDLLQLLQDEHARALRQLRAQQDALEALSSADGRARAIEGAVGEEPLRLPAAASRAIAHYHPDGVASQDVAALQRSVELLSAERDAIHADRLRLQRRLDAALRELVDVRERADAYSAERSRLVAEADRARDEADGTREEADRARDDAAAEAAAAAQQFGERLEELGAERDALAARAEEERREWAAERARSQHRIEALERAAQSLEARAEALAAERAVIAAGAERECSEHVAERAKMLAEQRAAIAAAQRECSEHVAERAKMLAAQRAAIAAAERERSDGAAERAQLQRERDALVVELQHAAEWMGAIGAERDAVAVRAERDRVEHAADRSRLQSRLDAMTDEIGRIGVQLGALAAEREKLGARAEHDELLLRQILASRSWRLTAPLRELAKTFK